MYFSIYVFKLTRKTHYIINQYLLIHESLSNRVSKDEGEGSEHSDLHDHSIALGPLRLLL